MIFIIDIGIMNIILFIIHAYHRVYYTLYVMLHNAAFNQRAILIIRSNKPQPLIRL